MKGPKLGGRVENIRLNRHVVSVIRPKKTVSYAEGSKKVDKMISKMKKR